MDVGERMVDSRTPGAMRALMKSINLLIICLLCGIVVAVTRRVSDAFMAREFLARVDKLPAVPWKPPVFALLSYIALLFLTRYRGKGSARESRFLVLGAAELLLSLVVIRALEFNDNSVILLVAADLMAYWKNTRTRIAFFAVLFLFYIATGFGVVSNFAPAISIDTYLAYYNGGMRTLLITMKSALSSLNILLFLLYMVFMIRIQFLEKERMSLKNRALDDANSRLREANRRLELYAAEAENNARTRERNRVAREIHDTLGHALTGIVAGIDACLTLLDRSPAAVKGQLNLIGDVARKGIRDVRRSVEALRPDALELGDLESALLSVARDAEAVSGTRIFFENRFGALRFQQDEEEVIYRLIQEGITNAIRHGRATRVDISIERQGGALVVRVRDDGAGCAHVVKGFGLRHIEERVALLGGTLEYGGDAGFTVAATIPIRWGDGA